MSSILAFSFYHLMPGHQQWVDQMWVSGFGPGLALTVGGIAFVFLGHSLYKFFAGISYAFLGWYLSITICELQHIESPYAPITCLGIGLLAGVLSIPVAKQAAAVLGGIVAAAIVLQLCAPGGSYSRAGLIAVALAFLAVTTLASVRHDEVVVFACTAVGAVMLVSGLLALFGSLPGYGRSFRQLLTLYPSLLWLSFGAPIVIGMAVQLSMLKNKGKAVLH